MMLPSELPWSAQEFRLSECTTMSGTTRGRRADQGGVGASPEVQRVLSTIQRHAGLRAPAEIRLLDIGDAAAGIGQSDSMKILGRAG